MSVVSVGRPSARGQLSLSIRGSTREKLHVCRQCGPGFAHGSNLRPCGQSHTGEKSPVCDGHGRAFSHGTNLILHWMVHTGEKSVGCDECEKPLGPTLKPTEDQKIHAGGNPISIMNVGKALVKVHIKNTFQERHF